MNTETNEKVIEIMQSLIESATSAKEFVLDQAPDVIYQLLLWKGIESLLCFLLSILLLVSFYFFVKWEFKSFESNGFIKNVYRQTDSFFIPFLNTISMAIIIMISVSIFSIDWLKIWLAPKLYLIEYASELIK